MTVENFVRIVWRVFEKIEKSRKGFEMKGMKGQGEKKQKNDCTSS